LADIGGKCSIQIHYIQYFITRENQYVDFILIIFINYKL